MGRDYSGDISGRFLFGLQDSDGLVKFGAEVSSPNSVHVYFNGMKYKSYREEDDTDSALDLNQVYNRFKTSLSDLKDVWSRLSVDFIDKDVIDDLELAFYGDYDKYGKEFRIISISKATIRIEEFINSIDILDLDTLFKNIIATFKSDHPESREHNYNGALLTWLVKLEDVLDSLMDVTNNLKDDIDVSFERMEFRILLHGVMGNLADISLALRAIPVLLKSGYFHIEAEI